MNELTCCRTTASTARNISNRTANGEIHPSSARRRGFKFVRFSLPTLILVLLPKCPACFAAYVALGTGISVSVAAVSLLRNLLIVICIASIVWIVASALRSALRERLSPGSRLI